MVRMRKGGGKQRGRDRWGQATAKRKAEKEQERLTEEGVFNWRIGGTNKKKGCEGNGVQTSQPNTERQRKETPEKREIEQEKQRGWDRPRQ